MGKINVSFYLKSIVFIILTIFYQIYYFIFLFTAFKIIPKDKTQSSTILYFILA